MGSYILPLEEIKYRVIQDGASFIGVDHLGGRRKALRVIFECSCGSIYEKLWGNIKKDFTPQHFQDFYMRKTCNKLELPEYILNFKRTLDDRT
jgi:hypothetical protein